VTCDFGTVTAGAPAKTAQIVVRADAAGLFSNRATVSGASADPDATNDSDVETTQIDARPGGGGGPAVPGAGSSPTPGAASPGGSSPAPGTSSPAPPGNDPGVRPAACRVQGIALVAIDATGSATRPRVRLGGIADASLIGRRVLVRRDSRTIAGTTVRKDGTVRLNVAAPKAARERAAARYRLVVGVHRSLALKATRRIAIADRETLDDGRVRLAGRIAGVERPTRLTVRGGRLCTKKPFGSPQTVRTDRTGRFSVTVAAPTAGQTALYRVEPAGRRTVTLPITVTGR
jgi:hypothetical protein